MRLILAICLSLLVSVTQKSFSQLPCIAVKIQSPVVSKVDEVRSTITNSCDEVKISWKGNGLQTYVVTGSSSEASGVASSVQPGPVNCDKDLNCSVTFPLKSASKLTWTIEAVQIVDKRTFYSYPLQGEVSACEQLIVDAGKSAKSETAVAKTNPAKKELPEADELTVYPNPVTGELTIHWRSEYKGNAQLSIIDPAGKSAKTMNIQKPQLNYSEQISVNTLQAGLYLIYIKMRNGRSVTTRFIKK